jgi:hypothetical protein
MGAFGSKPEPLSPEEVKELRTARKDYQDRIQQSRVNIQAAVNRKQITPESGREILSVQQNAINWLKKNPNANLSEVLANRDNTDTEINRIVQTDISKRIMKNLSLMIPGTTDQMVEKKLLDAKDASKLKAIGKEAEKWYSANSEKANQIEFEMEFTKYIDQIRVLLKDRAANDYFFDQFRSVANMQPSEVALLSEEERKAAKKAEESEITTKKVTTKITAVALNTFFGWLIVTLLVLCGSFAANAAIGRVPAYRVLYFFYGAFPLFAPFVLLYTIGRRIKEGRLPIYAILPISIEPATTRLGKLLWFPFYWVPDDYAIQAFKDFQASIESKATA